MRVKILSLGLLSGLLLASCGKKQETAQSSAPAYETLVTSKQNAELEMSYPATIKGTEDVEIRPQVDGFIKDIFVDEGSVVKKGQLLFTIDSPTTERDVLTAQATVASARAAKNTAQLDVDRIRPLAEKNIVSQVQLQTAINALATAKASLAEAEATLTTAKISRSWANVTSPVDGVVGTIAYRKGSLVSSSYALTTVANIGNVYAYFSLNEKDMNTFLSHLSGKTQAEKLKNAPAVGFILADGTEYPEKGKLQTISGTIDVTTGSANFRVQFANKSGQLRSGTSGNVIIPETIANTIVIPQNSTFTSQDKVLVYKVVADSVVQTVVNAVPLSDGENFAITDGLSVGDRIVKSGVATLSQGMKIKVK